ncbi:MAG: glycosyltransferase family 2 protein [Omnitrophica bacterium]|nr:glycosyltransferase family 2 protein [Candidatus Omnitrophota bacterium]
MKVWVVIPAYNEAATLSGILYQLKEKELSVLVIDDGSIDHTYSLAKSKADLVIKNDRNLGKGMSLNAGISYLIKTENFDYVLTMDADGQHSCEDIDNFLGEAKRGECFVIGNRMINPSGMPKIRMFINRFMSFIISKIAGQKIPDTQCGFRLIKREVLEKMIIKTNKFEIETELIIKAARLGFFIKSIPIKSIYFKGFHSRISPFIDTVRFWRFIIRSRH